MHHGAGPVLFSNRPDLAAQRVLRIADQPERKSAAGILPEGFVISVSCLIEPSVANKPFTELPPVLAWLGADPEDRDVVFLVSTVLIDKGRDLGPAPRSPLAAVEEHNRGRRFLQHGRKRNRAIIDILQGLLGKRYPDFQKCHGSRLNLST
jgi:hypothetical protein